MGEQIVEKDGSVHQKGVNQRKVKCPDTDFPLLTPVLAGRLPGAGDSNQVVLAMPLLDAHCPCLAQRSRACP